MYKTQIFHLIVNKVAVGCEVSVDEILGTSHRQDIVDARCMAYKIAMKLEDFTPMDIAIISGKGKPKAVRDLVDTFQDRWGRAQNFRTICRTAVKELKEELGIDEKVGEIDL